MNSAIVNLAYQASRHLCKYADLKKSMLSFFNYVNKIIPIEYILLGETISNNKGCTIYFFIDEKGIHEINKYYLLTEKQKKVVKHSPFFLSDKSLFTIIENEHHELAKIFHPSLVLGLPKYGHFPIIVYRVEDNGIKYGGINIGFKEGTELTDTIVTFFNLLESSFSIYIHAYNQQQELNKIKENKIEQIEIKDNSENIIIGCSSGLKYIINQIKQIAPFDISVLLRGESGTGKEVIAREIYRYSTLFNKSFIAVNCGAITPDLIDSALFGHEKGAFTGAINTHIGFFEQAKEGTLFLDEVAELPLNAQVRLLRVLQEKKICRVGSNKEIPVNFRLITATHRPLEKMIKLGKFREDLYYRINAVSLTIPPLRERKEDIPLFIQYFWEQAMKKYKINLPVIPEEEIQKLMDYNFPGNVRELQNMIMKEALLSHNGTITFTIENNFFQVNPAHQYHNTKDLPLFNEYVKNYLETMLKKCNGKLSGCGGMTEKTGLPRGTLQGKLDKYNIPYGKRKKNGLIS